jgi:twitching motility protein PilT
VHADRGTGGRTQPGRVGTQPDDRHGAEQELDCAHALPDKARFRLNVYFQRDSVGAAFRLIPQEIKPLEALGIPAQVSGLARLPRGFVLVTGPTGSGKSTTWPAWSTWPTGSARTTS